MTRHFRKLLLLPAIAAVALVSGCVSYGYRGGQGGDYYYGQPTTEYVYPYGYYDYGYPGYYGASPYWGSFGYYGYYGPYRPHRGDHGHGNGHGNGGGHGNGSGNHTPPPNPGSGSSRPPWRNLDRIGRPDAPARPTQRRSDPEFPRARTEPPVRSMPQQVHSMPPRTERMERPARSEGSGRAAPWRNAAGNPKRDARPNPAP